MQIFILYMYLYSYLRLFKYVLIVSRAYAQWVCIYSTLVHILYNILKIGVLCFRIYNKTKKLCHKQMLKISNNKFKISNANTNGVSLYAYLLEGMLMWKEKKFAPLKWFSDTGSKYCWNESVDFFFKAVYRLFFQGLSQVFMWRLIIIINLLIFG